MLKLRQLILLTILTFPIITNLSDAKERSEQQSTRFAVIGDFGLDGPDEKQVADLVKSWKPEFIVTLGDNNYPEGTAETMDHNVGKHYHDFIHPYKGQFGHGADRNRFFPILGNHDWRSKDAKPYLAYFNLPGNKRYYDFTWGPVHFFAIDSDKNEPDGITADSKQALWLKQKLASSTKPFKVVMLHHPPYSSGHHGSSETLRWPFKEWGATMVMSGHDHDYQRIEMDGLHYIVNGVGGQKLRDPFDKPEIPGTKKRFYEEHGAMLVEVIPNQMRCQFFTKHGRLIDRFNIKAKQLDFKN